jgi:YgiT-type zinc finger domain-containing protein
MPNETIEETRPCNECQAGVMHKKLMTYFTWLADELITVPNFPGWVCDVCSRREYDVQAINWLNMLLNPAAGKKTPHRKLPKTKPVKNNPRPQTDKSI